MSIKVITIDELRNPDPDELRKDAEEWAKDFHDAGGWENAPRIVVGEAAFEEIMEVCGITEEELPLLTTDMRVKH